MDDAARTSRCQPAACRSAQPNAGEPAASRRGSLAVRLRRGRRSRASRRAASGRGAPRRNLFQGSADQPSDWSVSAVAAAVGGSGRWEGPSSGDWSNRLMTGDVLPGLSRCDAAGVAAFEVCGLKNWRSRFG